MWTNTPAPAPGLHSYRVSKAQAACDVRNSRYDRRLQAAVEELADAAAPGGLPSSSSIPDRLNQAEKVAGKCAVCNTKHSSTH
jgi:hypothetical protein